MYFRLWICCLILHQHIEVISWLIWETCFYGSYTVCSMYTMHINFTSNNRNIFVLLQNCITGFKRVSNINALETLWVKPPFPLEGHLLYCYKLEKCEKKKCKGVKKKVVEKSITFENYKQCLFSEQDVMRQMNRWKSIK